MALGVFSGGQLWVEHRRGNAKPPLDPLEPPPRRLRGRSYCIRHRWLQFDPHAYHAVWPQEGRRMSITLYMPSGWPDITMELARNLEDAGFSVVAPSSMLTRTLTDDTVPEQQAYPTEQR
eukprot:4448784-Amphidinium_carterae.1